MATDAEIRIIVRDEATRVIREMHGEVTRLAKSGQGAQRSFIDVAESVNRASGFIIAGGIALRAVREISDFVANSVAEHARREEELRDKMADAASTAADYERQLAATGASIDFADVASRKFSEALAETSQRLGQAIENVVNLASVLPILIQSFIPGQREAARFNLQMMELGRGAATSRRFYEETGKSFEETTRRLETMRPRAMRLILDTNEQMARAAADHHSRMRSMEANFAFQTHQAQERFNLSVAQAAAQATERQRQLQFQFNLETERREFQHQQEMHRIQENQEEQRRQLLRRGGFWVQAEVREYLQRRKDLEKQGDEEALDSLDQSFMERLRIIDPILAEELEHLLEQQEEEKSATEEAFDKEQEIRDRAYQEQLAAIDRALNAQIAALSQAFNMQLETMRFSFEQQRQQLKEAYERQTAISRAGRERDLQDFLDTSRRRGEAARRHQEAMISWATRLQIELAARPAEHKTTLTVIHQDIYQEIREPTAPRLQRGFSGVIEGPRMFFIEPGMRERVTVTPQGERREGTGETPVVIHVHGNVIGEKETMEELARRVIRYWKAEEATGSRV